MAMPACFGETETETANETMVSDKLTDLFCAGLPESVTINVSGVALTIVVGVPLIVPVAASKVRPAGSAPPVRLQV